LIHSRPKQTSSKRFKIAPDGKAHAEQAARGKCAARELTRMQREGDRAKRLPDDVRACHELQALPGAWVNDFLRAPLPSTTSSSVSLE